MNEPSQSPTLKSTALRLAALGLAALVACGSVFFLLHWREKRRVAAEQAGWAVKQKISPSGGRPFHPRLELPVPQFSQSDPRWGSDQLGPSAKDSLASAGCAVASTAMVLASYGIDTDPKRLNAHLTSHDGYTPEGWLKWEAAATVAPDRVAFVYEDLPSYQLIDENLAEGNPVIVRVRYTNGVTHFVVICGKDGFDYLTRDPGQNGSKGVYPLRELASEIEALRFYSKFLPDPQPTAGSSPEKPAGK